ncbi:gamma carbonic anhydrase family protein [Burkholderia sp. Bp8963]|uniref:gamma carbonic anhydrase family protein n=1 Tax=Burkholderia sp. Bp8963 TaxID=2184547 RepID=UPI000F596CC2|nr:gamma carbonic anhydrase family protein [Burkholderia sp. Bp8963]RQS62199.1 gamma carbonic anhydrase family protein [Burkholderia sp. Bp8963]
MMLTYQGVEPTVGPACFVAPNAILVGSVRLEEKASVWFGAVLRGDVAAIRIGATSNVQDGVIIHADPGFPVDIGRGVTVGHAAKLHGCTVEDGALIGIGATVLDGAVIGKHALIGANALIPPGKVVPERALVMGSPGKIVRMLTDDEVKELAWAAEEYVRISAEFLPAPAVLPG